MNLTCVYRLMSWKLTFRALKKWYGKEQIFTPLPKYAEEKRDFAFVVDKNITCAQIENGIKEACDYVTDVTLFDVYEGIQLGADRRAWHSLLYLLRMRKSSQLRW